MPFHFRDVEYYMIITNASTRHAYTALASVDRWITVDSTSAAHIREVQGPTVMASGVDRQNWAASGSPLVQPYKRHWISTSTTPAGGFSFTPQGMPMTYQMVRELQADPSNIRRVVRSLLTGLYKDPGPAVLFRQYGYLLAAAPARPAVRAALFRAMAGLRGIYALGKDIDLLGRRGEAIFINSPPNQIEMLLAPRTGVVLAVEERNLGKLPFAGLAAGSLIDSDTFVT
jgi:hypothetical protein